MNESKYIPGYLRLKEQGFYADDSRFEILRQMGIDSVDAVFDYSGGENLHKENLTWHRQRVYIATPQGSANLYLKKYIRTPILRQIKNWIAHRRIITSAQCDIQYYDLLSNSGIETPFPVAVGFVRRGMFEKQSFVIMEELRDMEALERKLPGCFYQSGPDAIGKRREFIDQLAEFTSRFHGTGLRHRDYYLAHIFHNSGGRFALIDLHRCFRPMLLKERFRVKDLGQLYYPASADYFSKADRLRFYKVYKGVTKLGSADKRLIRAINKRAVKMALHDVKHSRKPGYFVKNDG